jgi:O-succinylbenzoate-CoA ligase
MNDMQALERSRRLVLGEILARNARKHGDKVALVFEGERRTFAELDERANRLANALAARGVTSGDKVALLMYNRLEVIESWFGCHKLGACPVPLNFRLVEREARYILEDSEAVGVIADDQLADMAQAARRNVSRLRFHLGVGQPGNAEPYEHALADTEPAAPDVLVESSDLAYLMYTSGTTGAPKGAMLTHLNLVMNTVNWVVEMGAGHDDVWLSGLPLFHIGGINGILPFVYTGGTSVVTSSTSFDPAESLRLLGEHAVTMCFFVPTQWQAIAEHPDAEKVDTTTLSRGLWGASQAPRRTLELMAEVFPNVGIVNAFGQTEMSSNTTFLQPDDALRKMGSVGQPVVNVEARIVDDEMRDCPPGTVGEIVYRGPTVMAGYHRNPEATEEALAGGWFHSGDLCVADDEGYITVVDRKKDMIISGGENIYPAEVEAVLMEHPGVREAAVIGVPHPKWVETPRAIVSTTEEASPTEQELVDFCKERLASYKKPTSVVFIDELPRNAAGKVLKRVLREHYSAG